MKALSTLAFGAIALIMANFATAAPAAAGNVGIYAGSDGFAIQVGHYDHYGYYRDPCRSYWYRRHHPYRCGYYGHYTPYYSRHHYYYGGHRPYYKKWRHHRHHWRHHRRHHRHHRHYDHW